MADVPAMRTASARRSASLPRPLPSVDEAPGCEASAAEGEEEGGASKKEGCPLDRQGSGSGSGGSIEAREPARPTVQRDVCHSM